MKSIMLIQNYKFSHSWFMCFQAQEPSNIPKWNEEWWTIVEPSIPTFQKKPKSTLTKTREIKKSMIIFTISENS